MVLNNNSFQNVTNSVGIYWSRQRGDEAFSVSFTDYNNDGLPDIWIDGHGYNGLAALFGPKFPALYINNGNGTFTNLFESDPRLGTGGDTHAAILIDYDNDGDADTFTASGGELGITSSGQPNVFLIIEIVNLVLSLMKLLILTLNMLLVEVVLQLGLILIKMAY